MVVVGDRQMAVFDDVEKENKLSFTPRYSLRNHYPIPSKAESQPIPLDLQEPLRAECLHLACMQTRQTPRTDGEEGLRVLIVNNVNSLTRQSCADVGDCGPVVTCIFRPRVSLH